MNDLMQRLQVWRSYARRILAAGDPYIVMAAKAVTALAVLLSVNAAFPYRAVLSRGLIVAAVSLLCSILPWTYITVFGAFFVLGQLSALSLEAFAFVLVIIVVLAVLSYITLPGCGILLALLPVLIGWKIPTAAVLLAGVFGGITAFVSVAGGTMLYYVFRLIADNADILSGAVSVTPSGETVSTLVQRLLLLVKGFLNNEEMLAALIVFSLTTLLVHLLSRADVDYARLIAVGTGAVFCPVLMTAAFRLGELPISAGTVILDVLVGLFVTLAAVFFSISLDYPRAEKVQFEDDDYYYFVKAVPKIELPEEQTEKGDE